MISDLLYLFAYVKFINCGPNFLERGGRADLRCFLLDVCCICMKIVAPGSFKLHSNIRFADRKEIFGNLSLATESVIGSQLGLESSCEMSSPICSVR